MDGCSRIAGAEGGVCAVHELEFWAEVAEIAVPDEPAPAADCPPWQGHAGREGALTGRVPVVKGRLVQSWAPRIASGLEDF